MRNRRISYILEALELGIFMFLAICVVVATIDPQSVLHPKISEPFLQRFFIGLGMALSAVLIIYSPLGKFSGAHFNPAVSITFWRLGKMNGFDCACYVFSQFVGGLSGVWLASLLLGDLVAHPSVAYIVTKPGMSGQFIAFAAETVISFILMMVVLCSSNSIRYNRYTGLFVGGLLILFILFEAPFSGMSMNPARSFASIYFHGNWSDLWIYLISPLIGMLGAAQLYLLFNRKVYCAKLHHMNPMPCIFVCEFESLRSKK